MKFLTHDWTIGSLLITGLLFPLLILKFDLNIGESNLIDPSIASDIAGYIAGTTGVVWGLASILFIYKSIIESKSDRAEDQFNIWMDNLKDVIINTEGEVHNASPYLDSNQLKGYPFFSGVLNHYHGVCKLKETQMEYKSQTGEQSTISLPHGRENNFKYTKEYLTWCYRRVYPTYQTQLGIFYRLVYNIFNHVHQNEYLKPEQKKKLINKIQTQLNNDQLGLVFYNVLSGYDKFYEFLNENYPNFLQNIDPHCLVQTYNTEFFPNVDFRMNE